jgi:hypothetical protein
MYSMLSEYESGIEKTTSIVVAIIQRWSECDCLFVFDCMRMGKSRKRAQVTLSFGL